jgi:hypothetical protein
MFDIVVATTVDPDSLPRSCIAVHHAALGIAKQGAVGVAVKSDSQIKLPTRLADGSAQRLRV